MIQNSSDLERDRERDTLVEWVSSSTEGSHHVE